jgi:hypothetical protein
MKKQMYIALLGMLMISILPGCGKKKNDAAIVSPGYVPPYYGGMAVANGCATVPYGYTSGIANLYFSGPAGVSLNGISSQMSLTGIAPPGGNIYYRNNNAGDTLTLYTSAGATAYATVSLSALTISSLSGGGGGYGGYGYGQGAQICGLLFSNAGLSANNYNNNGYGSVYGNIYLITSMGYLPL